MKRAKNFMEPKARVSFVIADMNLGGTLPSTPTVSQHKFLTARRDALRHFIALRRQR